MIAEIKVPAVGESITEATIAEWLKSDGEFVQRDEVLLSLETDKASVEVVAENAGVLNIKAQEGDVVEIGAVIGGIDTEAQAPAGAAAPAEPAAAAGTPPATTNGSTHPELKQGLSPAVRKAVDEKGLDPSQISGSGRGGRLTKADVQGATPAAPTASPAPAAKAPKIELPTAFMAPGEERREPMSNLRKTIARRLVEAQQTAAILTTFNEIDMSEAMALRKRYKDKFLDKYGIKLGFMGLFCKAAIEALKEFPRVNASIDGDEVVYRNFVNMGIAVSTDKGLLVPVIKNADQLSLAEVEMSIMHYAQKARDGKISIDDLSGGSFTVSNGGVFGSLMSTPILNPPQSGILGLHKIEERPVAIKGQVEVRPMMYIALSYDHRIIDGKESVSFLVRIKEMMEDPSRILLEI